MSSCIDSVYITSVAIIIILIPEHADSIHNVTAYNGSMSCHIYYANIIGSVLFKDIIMAFTGPHGKVRGYPWVLV